MAMDSSGCNGSGEAPKVELEGKTGVEFGSEKDLAKSDGIASTEREMNDQDEIGGPYVIINGDSDNPSEKILKLGGKADPETTGVDEVSSIFLMNAGNGIEGKEMEGVKLESGCDPAQEGPSELEGKLEETSKEGSENGELSENRESNLEIRESAEKKELSEEIMFEEINQDKLKDQELVVSGENKYSSVEPVIGEVCDETGQECELSLAGDVEMYQSETANGEDDRAKLVFESGEKEEEHPVSGSIEGIDEENGRVHELETIAGEPNQHRELDMTLMVEEQVPQEIEQEAASAPSAQIMSEESGALSDNGIQKEAEMLVSVSEDPILNFAVEVKSEQKHEIQQEAPVLFKEEIHEESQGSCDSLQSSKEVEIPETESKEQSLLDSTVGINSKLKYELPQVGSGPSQEDEQQEGSQGVYNSMQSNKESGTPVTELNNQSRLDLAVKAESEQKLEEQQEASILSQEEDVHEQREVSVPSDHQKEFSEAPETDVKEIPSSDFETEARVVDDSTCGTKIEDQDTATTVCNGKENGESETAPSSFLFEKEKHPPSSTFPNQKKIAESETKQESVLLETNGESEMAISDTVADEEVLSESTKEVEEIQNPERNDAACDAQAVSTSHGIEVDSRSVTENELIASHGIEVDSRSVTENELIESSSEILTDSENKNTSEVEESDRYVTEFEDGQSKTEAETISVSSNDASTREIGLEDSVQIGKFKISIGENGPSILQRELQESSETTETATPEEPVTSTSNAEKPEGQLKRQPIYIIKVPRHSDEEQWEKIQEAQARLDELTRTRDAIRDIMQKRRVMTTGPSHFISSFMYVYLILLYLPVL
jgi:hypothetical protein